MDNAYYSFEDYINSRYPRKISLKITSEIWYLRTRSPLTIGPVVRIGPSNISVQGAEAVQLVYGRESKWVKPPYEPDGGKIALSSHGLIGLPGVNDRKCRKLLETCFSEKAIAKQQGVILNCVDTALTVTEIACEGDEGKVDILQIARTYAFDVISIPCFEEVNN